MRTPQGQVVVTYTSLLIQFNCFETDRYRVESFVDLLYDIIRDVSNAQSRMLRFYAVESLHELESCYPGLLLPLLGEEWASFHPEFLSGRGPKAPGQPSGDVAGPSGASSGGEEGPLVPPPAETLGAFVHRELTHIAEGYARLFLLTFENFTRDVLVNYYKQGAPSASFGPAGLDRRSRIGGGPLHGAGGPPPRGGGPPAVGGGGPPRPPSPGAWDFEDVVPLVEEELYYARALEASASSSSDESDEIGSDSDCGSEFTATTDGTFLHTDVSDMEPAGGYGVPRGRGVSASPVEGVETAQQGGNNGSRDGTKYSAALLRENNKAFSPRRAGTTSATSNGGGGFFYSYKLPAFVTDRNVGEDFLLLENQPKLSKKALPRRLVRILTRAISLVLETLPLCSSWSKLYFAERLPFFTQVLHVLMEFFLFLEQSVCTTKNRFRWTGSTIQRKRTQMEQTLPGDGNAFFFMEIFCVS